MSEYEEAKARIQPILNELNQCEDSEEEAHGWAHKLDLLLQAADKEIATKDAELARLREALEKIAKPEMPVNALVLMKIAQEALKSNDS